MTKGRRKDAREARPDARGASTVLTRPQTEYTIRMWHRKRYFCFHREQASDFPECGAVAQLGERMTGSHEVRGSIPLSSTISLYLLDVLFPL